MRRLALLTASLVALFISAGGASEPTTVVDVPTTPEPPNLVTQANAPPSDVLQLRIQDVYAPEFQGLDGQGNTVAIGITFGLALLYPSFGHGEGR